MKDENTINGDPTYLESFSDLNPNPVLEIDSLGHVYYLNPATRRLFPDLKKLESKHLFLAGLETGISNFKKNKLAFFERQIKVGHVWFQQVVYHIPDKKRVRIYALDITEQKKLQEAMEVSEIRFRRLFETAQDGIFLLDADSGQITEVNPYLINMLGFSREEILGKKLWEVGFIADIEASKAAFLELQTKEYIRYEDLPLLTKDGRQLDVEFVSNVYLVDHEKVIQCNVRDVSARVKLERIKEGIARTVFHDLRNPLTIVKEGLNIVLDKTLGEINEKQESVLAIVSHAIGRLVVMTGNLLDISKLETGKIELKYGVVNVSSSIKQVVLFYKLVAEKKGLELKMKLPEQDVYIHSDEDKIFQIFSNLIGNAIKFTDKGGVEVSVVEKEDSIECTVIDTGRGILNDDLPKLFTKFHQVGDILRGKDGGMGLGLVIVKDIIESYKGKVWIESSTLKNLPLGSQGTKFIFILPKDPRRK